MKQSKELDWNSFGDELWNIANIFRSGKDINSFWKLYDDVGKEIG